MTEDGTGDPVQPRGSLLDGVRVVEIGSMGPASMCAMMLADFGADIVRVDRTAEADLEYADPQDTDIITRGRPSIALDLKHPRGAAVVLDLVERADVLIEGFRPGVAERLGIGPDPCVARNPGLVYGRMTGYGQDGPLASTAGHDLNYLALAGILGALGPAGQPPSTPLNLIGDFGGGGVLLAFAIVAALFERTRSGLGQVIDCSMVEGSALLMTANTGPMQVGWWTRDRGTNLIDGGAHFYNTYETAEGGFVTFGAIEPQFYAAMLHGLGLDPADLPDQSAREEWPSMRARVADVVRTKTRAEWEEAFTGLEACFSVVLDPLDAFDHPHNVERGTFVEVGGLRQAAPQPRFSRTPGSIRRSGSHPGQDTDAALAAWDFDADAIAKLHADGVIRQGGASRKTRDAGPETDHTAPESGP
ncbi:MAG: CoA transferase [Actinomycetia bacterium]|nr:CoA transferase [Actinomycetes bacterium]